MQQKRGLIADERLYISRIYELRRNLINVGTAERDAKVKIGQDRMKFYLNGQLKMEARLNKNNLYELKLRH